MERIIGLLISGFAVRAAALVIGAYLALTIGGEVIETFQSVQAGFTLAPPR
jgi:hypothetical protein